MTIESDTRNEFRFPSYSRGEVLADAAAHITGLTFGFVATIELLITASHHDEGLLILGWVAMWRPIEVLLYDWWPLARRRTLLRRLATIPVEVRST